MRLLMRRMYTFCAPCASLLRKIEFTASHLKRKS
jgi:hypothetical protein